MSKIELSQKQKPLFTNYLLTPIYQLFAEAVLELPNVNGPYSAESLKIKDVHRKQLLNQGRTDFDVSSSELTAIQKVDLYCFYYFQMHYSSCRAFYREESEVIKNLINEKTIWFIDIGCGPFTSGSAFDAWINETKELNFIELHYMGVDISTQMIAKAKHLSATIAHSNYNTIDFTENRDTLLQVPNFIKETESDILIILNYSYLFASYKLDVQEFVDFTKKLVDVYCKSKTEATIVIFQQNPNYDFLNVKWNLYKARLADLFAGKKGYPKVITFDYDDLLESSNAGELNFRVKCDLLKSI
jgi:SAM-dependent methyltransferase